MFPIRILIKQTNTRCTSFNFTAITLRHRPFHIPAYNGCTVVYCFALLNMFLSIITIDFLLHTCYNNIEYLSNYSVIIGISVGVVFIEDKKTLFLHRQRLCGTVCDDMAFGCVRTRLRFRSVPGIRGSHRALRFYGRTVPGLTGGCLVFNITSTVSPLDMLFGTAARCCGTVCKPCAQCA